MSRDLLYKPPVPLQLPDEEEEDGKKVKDAKANASVPGKGTPAAQGPKGAPRPAFMNQYFNRDVNALSQANQAQSGMRALRGEESAMDLKKIVLPTPDGLEQTEGLAEIASKVVSACERSEGVRGALVGLAQWAQDAGLDVMDIISGGRERRAPRLQSFVMVAQKPEDNQ